MAGSIPSPPLASIGCALNGEPERAPKAGWPRRILWPRIGRVQRLAVAKKNDWGPGNGLDH
jgi:hypothetical protein